MIAEFVFKEDGEDERILVHKTKYRDGKLAITSTTVYGEPFGTLSVNTPHELEEDEFVVNHDTTQIGWDKYYMQTGVFEDTGKRVDYGWVSNQPVWRLKGGE